MSKNSTILLGAIIAVIIALIFVLGDTGDEIIESFDKTGEELSVYVNLYDSHREMIEDAEKMVGESLDPAHLGIAVYSPDDNRCDIFALKPKKVDGDRTLTIGHEMLHCLYGEVHE